MSEAVAGELLAASRELGEAVNPTIYPTVAMVERETHFNAMNPFWRAPIAYGAALVLLVISLVFVNGRGQADAVLAFCGRRCTVSGWLLLPPVSGWRCMDSIFACGSRAGPR